MHRRTFLHGLTAGALGAGRAWAQPRGPEAPSRLAEGKPSQTALGTATLRAAHQLFDHPKIFDDPLALRIIGPLSETAVRLTGGRGPSAPLRPFVAVRSRFTEDELAKAVQRGVRQYVVLGAGLDTFAYRNPYPASRLRVFEVDHPSTQVWKRAKLKSAGIALPPTLTFAAIDFETQTLAGGLAQAGFDAGEPAFFSLLGVVLYLTREAAMGTLTFVGARPAGSEIVFDYLVDPAEMNEVDRILHRRSADELAARGEPWLSYFAPGPLAADLRGAGFTHVEDLGPDEIHARYFHGRTDGLRVNSMARLVKATR